MQGRGNRHGRIWLLSGTGEGPRLAAALLQLGWFVEASVVTPAAARAYDGLKLHHLHIGPLQGQEAIRALLKDGRTYQWVIDATHPFAVQVSADLATACAACGQPLLRLERPLEHGGQVDHLESSDALKGIDLSGRHLLLAVGGRHLGRLHRVAVDAGAEVFARCLPSAAGVRAALSAGLPTDHLAVLQPLTGAFPGAIERALCRRWQITDVLCRQSGGITERLWRQLSEALGLRLLLLDRPRPVLSVETVESEAAVLERIGRHVDMPNATTHE
jgi:precorrin-6A/cobalt-precorrin-6A reductase